MDQRKDTDVPALIEHLEARLGRIGGGWPSVDEEGNAGVKTAFFSGGQQHGVLSYATIGASLHVVRSRNNGRPLHLEFIISVARDEVEGNPFALLLRRVVAAMCDSGMAPLRGDVLPFPNAGLKLSHVYCSLPFGYDDSFPSVVDEAGRKIGIVQLIPISDSEASFVRSEGWSKFEDVLADSGADLFDLDRAPVV